MKLRDVRTLVVVLLIAAGCAKSRMEPPAATPAVQEPAFLAYADLKWDPIIPDLGAKSPEITILHVDPTTHARTVKPSASWLGGIARTNRLP